MQLILAFIGKLKQNATTSLFQQYYARIEPIVKNIGISKVIIQEIAQSKHSDETLRSLEEGKKLLALVTTGVRLVICDEKGLNVDSRVFTQKLKNETNLATKAIIIAIGGDAGFSAEVKAAAHNAISFGKLTWPHQLARIMLVEQIYRAITIAMNHPYHRD